MLLKLQQTLIGQLKLLTIALAISGTLCALLGWSPLMRASGSMLIRGAVLGLTLAIIAFVLELLLLRIKRSIAKDYLAELRFAHESFAKRSAFAAVGALLGACCGEELLLRGVLFGWLAGVDVGWTVGNVLATVSAFCLNAVLSFAVHSDVKRFRPTLWRYAAVQTLMGTLLAIAFYREHSLCLILAARAVFELLHTLPLRSKRAIRQIQNRSLLRS